MDQIIGYSIAIVFWGTMGWVVYETFRRMIAVSR